MAFIDQVQDLTSLTITDNGELTQFLNDGVIDVTNRCIAMKPQNAEKFSRRSGLTTTQGYDPGGADIISVIRESGTADDWRPCMKTSPALQSRVTDTNSLYFASAYNPVFTVEDDGKIYVYPAPGSSPNGYKVYFVNTSPIDGAGNPLAQDDSTIGSFPNDKVYLVVMYAGIRVLGAAMGAKTINDLTLTPVTPDISSIPNFTITTTETLPSYTKLITSYDPGAPTDLSAVHPFSQTVTDISAFTGIITVPPDSPSLTPMAFTGAGADASITNISTSNTNVASLSDVGEGVVTLPAAPTYLPPAPPDRPDFDTSITDEDIEMVQAKAQQYQVELTMYGAEMTDAINEFNEANALYQAGIQKAMSDAQADNTMITQSLQKNLTIAQADAAASNSLEQANKAIAMQNAVTDMQEIVHKNDFYIKEWQQGTAVYQAEAGTEVEEYQTKLAKYGQEIQKELAIWTQERQGEIQEHGQKIARFQALVVDELNSFNTQLQTYQAEVTVLLQEAQYEQQAEHSAALQQYQAEIAAYGAEVNAAAQEYQSNLQADQAEYTWLQDQYTRLKADYDAAFVILAGPQQREARA